MTNLPNLSIRFPEYMETLSTIQALKAYNIRGTKAGDTVQVTGLLKFNDGLGGDYVWDPQSVLSDDGNTVVRPNVVTTGRWIKIQTGVTVDAIANSGDISTFAIAKTAKILSFVQNIRIGDRGNFTRDTGAFGTLPAAGENYWWFRDGAGSLWLVSGDQINIKAVGAVNSKTIDNQLALQAALDFGTLSGRNVLVPAGTYNYTGFLVVRNKTGLIGVPGQSILYCTAVDTGAIIMEGSGGTLYGITRLQYLPRPVGINARSANDLADGIYCRGALNFTIQFCRTEGPQGASLMLRGCQYGRVTNNWFESSLADSIHITAAGRNDAPIYRVDGSYIGLNQTPIPCYRLHIADNIINNSGDDNIAIVSYADHAIAVPTGDPVVSYAGYYTYNTVNGGTRILQACNQSINIVGNSTYGGDARGITVVGGKNVNITGNYIEDPVQAGILAYGEDSYNTYGCENVNIVGNTLVNTGNGGDYRPLRYDAYGNQMLNRSNVLGLTRNNDFVANASVIISGRSFLPSSNVSFRGNMLIGIRQRGVSVDAFVTNVDITGNNFRDSVGVAIFANAGANINIKDNRVTDARDGAIGVNIFNCSGHVVVDGNQLHNINTSGSGGTDAIHFEGQPAAGVISTTISNNKISGPQTYERFIEAFFDNVIAENNTGSPDVGLGGVPNSVKQRVKGANTVSKTNTASNAGAAPSALTQAVTQTDYNALVTFTNDLKDKYNGLLTILYNAGLTK